MIELLILNNWQVIFIQGETLIYDAQPVLFQALIQTLLERRLILQENICPSAGTLS